MGHCILLAHGAFKHHPGDDRQAGETAATRRRGMRVSGVLAFRRRRLPCVVRRRNGQRRRSGDVRAGRAHRRPPVSSGVRRRRGTKRTARPFCVTSTIATVGPSSSSSGEVAVPGLSCSWPSTQTAVGVCRWPQTTRSGRARSSPTPILPAREALEQPLRLVRDHEAHASDLAGRLGRQVGGGAGAVEVAGHRRHRRDGLQGHEDLGVDDVAGMDDVRHAGEDLEDLGVEVAVVVADHADAQRRLRVARETAGGSPCGGTVCGRTACGRSASRRPRCSCVASAVTVASPCSHASGAVYPRPHYVTCPVTAAIKGHSPRVRRPPPPRAVRT